MDQQPDQDLPWETFIADRPIAFCVGCRNAPEEVDKLVSKFSGLGLKVVRGEHRTRHTAIIARNDRFIKDLEAGMSIR